jgi:hypothetical protein
MTIRSILFICTGNTGRSVAAEGPSPGAKSPRVACP